MHHERWQLHIAWVTQPFDSQHLDSVHSPPSLSFCFAAFLSNSSLPSSVNKYTSVPSFNGAKPTKHFTEHSRSFNYHLPGRSLHSPRKKNRWIHININLKKVIPFYLILNCYMELPFPHPYPPPTEREW